MLANIKYFDKTLGQSKRLCGELKLVSERITARDLIRRRIEQEFAAVDQKTEKTNWLIIPDRKEKTLNGSRQFGPGSIDGVDLVDKNVDVALLGFEKQSFLLFVDNHQVEALDECITLSDNCTLTFIKLVPLVGG